MKSQANCILRGSCVAHYNFQRITRGKITKFQKCDKENKVNLLCIFVHGMVNTLFLSHECLSRAHNMQERLFFIVYNLSAALAVYDEVATITIYFSSFSN